MKEEKNQNINEIAKLTPETEAERKNKEKANLNAISTVGSRRASAIKPTITATAGEFAEPEETAAKRRSARRGKSAEGGKSVEGVKSSTQKNHGRYKEAVARKRVHRKSASTSGEKVHSQSADTNDRKVQIESAKLEGKTQRRRRIGRRENESTVEFVLRVVAGALILISLLSFQNGYYHIKAKDGSAKDLKFRNVGIHLALPKGNDDSRTAEADSSKSDKKTVSEAASDVKDTDTSDASAKSSDESTADTKSDDEKDSSKSSSKKKSSKSSDKKTSSKSKKSSKKKSKEKDPYDIDSYKLSYDGVYKVTKHKLNMKIGETYFNGHKETYYSQTVLPGGALKIPGRHVAADGTVRDKDGYICVAAPLDGSYLSMGDTILTSLGPGKVYDEGAMEGEWIDIYTNW